MAGIVATFCVELLQFLAHGLDVLGCWGVVLVGFGGRFGLVPGEADEVGGSCDACLLAVEHAVVEQPEGLPSDLLPRGALTDAVASDDALDFPQAQFVEELARRDAYFAYDELVYVIDGAYFFWSWSPSCASCPDASVSSSLSPSGVAAHWE